MRIFAFSLMGAAALAAFWSVSHAQSQTPSPSVAGPFTAAQAQAGRAAYAASCASCHQANLAGVGEQPPLAGALSRRPAPWYEHAVGPFITGWLGLDNSVPIFLSRPNSSLYFDFEADDVMEIAHTINHGELVPQLRDGERGRP